MTTSATKVDIWMPVYVGDYLASTTRLTTAQHGAYFLMLLDYWKNGPPPDDDLTLSQIARLPVENWREIQHSISSFFQISDGKWIHPASDERLEEAKRNRINASNRGKLGAEARYRLKNNVLTIDEVMLHPSTEDGSSSSSSSVTLSPPASVASSKTKVNEKSIGVESEKFDLFWSIWPTDKNKVRRFEAQEFWGAERLSEHFDTIVAHVKSSITGEQWQGGFVPVPYNYLKQKMWLDGPPKQVPQFSFGRRVL